MIRFVGVRSYADPSASVYQDVTSDEVRKMLMVLFGSNFTDPKDFASGKLKNNLQTSLDYFTFKVFNEVNGEDLELKNYRIFYNLLKRAGLSTGPALSTKTTQTTGRIRRRKIEFPYSFKLYNPPNGAYAAFLNERAFYEPVIDWLYHVFHLKESDYQFKFPKGAEFHWASHAHNLAIHFQDDPQGFARLIAPRLGKIDPYYCRLLVMNAKPGMKLSKIHKYRFRNLNRFEQGCPKRAQYLLDQLKKQTREYLDQVDHADLRLKALSMPSEEQSVAATDILNRVQAVSISRRVTNDLCKLLVKQESIGDIGQYRDDWLRTEPFMSGFLFPDGERSRLSQEFKMSKSRYGFDSKSLWEIFQTMTSNRPLEILLPPGYRLFVSRTLPDFSRPRPVDYHQVKIFPKYDVERQPSILPSYDFLKKYYTDLDVSFLPEEPKPELRQPRLFVDLEAEAPVTVPTGPYPNYFQYPSTLAHKQGELDLSFLIRHWISNYYLGAQNWIKDMPRNFLGSKDLRVVIKFHAL